MKDKPSGHPGIYWRGGTLWIQFYDQQGGRRRESTRSKSIRDAKRLRAQLLAEVSKGQYVPRKAPRLREFVEKTWRPVCAPMLKPSTLRGYETALTHHLLPAFGDHRLDAITRGMVRSFIATKARQKRWAYSKPPNPNRPTLSKKTILNAVGLLSAIIETATVEHDLLPVNPIRGILKRRNFADFRPQEHRPHVLEPDDFRRSIANLTSPVLEAVLFAAFAGVRWSEQTAICTEDADFRRNKIRVWRSLYRRVAQKPKTASSIREVDMTPAVRQILKAVAWNEGYVLSPDGGRTPLGDGSWLKRQWTKAQVKSGIKLPIRWHDLRHQYVSLMYAAGRDPAWISKQAGHASLSQTLDRYHHLFETVTRTPVEWPEDLIWPTGFDLSTVAEIVAVSNRTGREKTGEQGFDGMAESQAERTRRE